jgi:hypothetical protein
MSNYQEFDFKIVDYKNEQVLSAYALKETPLTFTPNVENLFYIRVLWDFGDGTYSTSLTSKKYYDKAGKYDTNLTIFDCYSNAIISNTIKTVDIKDYLVNTFKIDFEDASYYDNITWKNGKISGPLIASATYPNNITPSSIFYRISGSNSEYYFQDIPDKFKHLRNTYSFFDKIYNQTKKEYEYVEIDKIEIDTIPVYAKISNNNIILTDSSDVLAFYVGLSGNKKVYFKDDSVNKLQIDLFFDRRNNNIWDNNLKISLSANIAANTDVDNFSITSNGMDGEFYAKNSFNIDTEKFSNVDIPFVIKVKDLEHFTVKNFQPLSASNLAYTVLSSNEVVSSQYYTISAKDSFNGALRNTIRFTSPNKINDVKITVSGSVSSVQGSAYSLNGETSLFDVYPQNFLMIEKKNESYDATEMFKDLRFQEFLLDDSMLFDEFMGSIFGTLSSSYDTLGKKIYEKITNFVQNTQDIDRNEIFSLISQMKMVNTPNNVFEDNSFTYPEKIKRILDLFSISNNKLLGIENKFKENFDLRGYSSKSVYGINLGNGINTATYVVSAGTPIVALEKFSNKYSLLNTEQPVEYTTTNIYTLSSYNQNWGWPLVLPDTFQFQDIEKYYLFFEFVDTFDNTLYDNTIIKDNTLYDMLSTENGILRDSNNDPILDENGDYIFSDYITPPYKDFTMGIVLRDTLYQSLSLVK